MNKEVEVSLNTNFDFFKRIYSIFKRIFDIVFSIIGLIFLVPVTIFVKILYLIEGDKNSIIFKQKRTGKNGKEFELIKFRTMVIDNDVRNFKKENKMTKTGEIIRKLSLDELPQFINIFKGEMSFVGPRPWIPEYFEYMTENQKQRVAVLPGLTGLAQVNGRNGLSVIDKINYDLVYVEKYSLFEDLKIFFKTIATVFKKEHAAIEKSGIKTEIETLKKQKR